MKKLLILLLLCLPLTVRAQAAEFIAPAVFPCYPETTYRNKELTDRNLIIRSFIVTKYQENNNVSGRTPTKNAKKIKSVQ